METRTKIRMRLGVVMAGWLLLILLYSGPGINRVSSAAPQACVAGSHSGIIGTQQWCVADSPHLIDGDLTVSAGMTLTVEAGVTVQGVDYAELLVVGHLEALGTTAQPITFTSSANTGPEQWSGLAFDGGSGHLRHATVRYSGWKQDEMGCKPGKLWFQIDRQTADMSPK